VLVLVLLGLAGAVEPSCHTQCGYVPLPPDAPCGFVATEEPWSVGLPLRVVAGCVSDCWHVSQGSQPGPPPFWIPADSFGPGGLQDVSSSEVVPAESTLVETCDLLAVFAVDVALAPDTTYAFLGPARHSHEVTPSGTLQTGPPLEPVGPATAHTGTIADDAGSARRPNRGSDADGGCVHVSGAWGWLLEPFRRKRLPG